MSTTVSAAKTGGPVQSTSPMKATTRPPTVTKPTPPATSPNPDTNTPTNATAKGSRRAQGWHSAVGGAAGTGLTSTTSSNAGIRETHSNLDGKGLLNSRVGSGMPRRSSVQFSEDAMDNRSSPRAPSKPRAAATANKDDAAFRQSMADFLTVMYGDRPSASSSGSAAASTSGRDKGTGSTGGGGGGGTSAAGGAGRGDTPKAPRSSSPHLPPSGMKGPLVKGLTANGSRHATGDRIDTLVDTLVRAYSRQATSSRGDFHGSTGGPDDDNPISYNRPRHQNYRRAVASPRLGRSSGTGSGVDTNEVSLFVSQAMDSFIGPGGLRQQGLPSTRSVLSSLGVDKNIFGLMSFETRSNMQEVDAVEEEGSDTKLEPMYVGEQALFKSVGARPNMNDISVSRSMRGVIPSPATAEAIPTNAGGGGQRRISNTSGGNTGNDSARYRLQNSTMSLESGVTSGKRDSGAGQQSGRPGVRSATRTFSNGGSGGSNGNNKSVTRCMSLDSKALGAANGGADDEDDSWGDSATAPQPPARASVVVSSARSLLDYSKSRHGAALETALGELFEEEQLKRDVVMAVERQLRGYITALETEEREKKRSQKGSGKGVVAAALAPASLGAKRTGSSAQEGAVTPAERGKGSSSGRSGGGGTAVNSAASPPMKNMVDFFEKSGAPMAQTDTVKRLSR